MHPGSRWVGFDVDECLGSFMPLWPYVDYLFGRLPKQTQLAILPDMLKRLSDANTSGRIWVFRPGMDALLRDLSVAFEAGQIAGCFLLSNNASHRLIQFVRHLLNYRVERLVGTSVPLFAAGWHRTAPSRRGDETKNWTLIQRSLVSHRIPKMVDKQDLLFFDDIDHVLRGEIPHYVKVPPYVYVTPHSNVYRVLQSLFSHHDIPASLQQEAIRQGDLFEAQDHKDRFYKFVSPPSGMDTSVFRTALQRFLRGDSFAKTRKVEQRRRKTMKRLWNHYETAKIERPLPHRWLV
jgi:hypothetical protein